MGLERGQDYIVFSKAIQWYGGRLVRGALLATKSHLFFEPQQAQPGAAQESLPTAGLKQLAEQADSTRALVAALGQRLPASRERRNVLPIPEIEVFKFAGGLFGGLVVKYPGAPAHVFRVRGRVNRRTLERFYDDIVHLADRAYRYQCRRRKRLKIGN